MSLSVLLISGSYKVYADPNSQIYKCISQNGQIAYQDYVCKKGSIVENMVFTVNSDVVSGLRAHETKAFEHMHQRMHQERDHAHQANIARRKAQLISTPQPQQFVLHLQHNNLQSSSVVQRVNQTSLNINK